MPKPPLDENYIRTNYYSKTTKQMASDLGCNERSIRRTARRLGLTKKKNNIAGRFEYTDLEGETGWLTIKEIASIVGRSHFTVRNNLIRNKEHYKCA